MNVACNHRKNARISIFQCAYNVVENRKRQPNQYTLIREPLPAVNKVHTHTMKH